MVGSSTTTFCHPCLDCPLAKTSYGNVVLYRYAGDKEWWARRNVGDKIIDQSGVVDYQSLFP